MILRQGVHFYNPQPSCPPVSMCNSAEPHVHIAPHRLARCPFSIAGSFIAPIPGCTNAPAPGRALPLDQVGKLIHMAEAHGVLGVVVSEFSRFSRRWRVRRGACGCRFAIARMRLLRCCCRARRTRLRKI